MTSALQAIISRPKTVLTLMVFMIAAGIMSYISIPKEANPDIDVPVYFVSINQQGISPGCYRQRGRGGVYQRGTEGFPVRCGIVKPDLPICVCYHKILASLFRCQGHQCTRGHLKRTNLL